MSPARQTRRTRIARRRKRRLERVENDLTEPQWAALKLAWAGCAYCGQQDRPLQRDCVMAISRGGRYTLDNVAPACGPCNASKCNTEVTAWMRRKKYDERGFLVRHVEVTRLLTSQFAEAVDKSATVTSSSLSGAYPLGQTPGLR